MRAARQDLFEQGDVWARVAGYRKPPPGTSPAQPPVEKVRRLITADAYANYVALTQLRCQVKNFRCRFQAKMPHGVKYPQQ